MSGKVRGVERFLRWISRLGIALFIVGTIAVGVGALKAAAEAGISPVSAPINLDQMYVVLLGGGALVLGGALLNVLTGILANVLATTQEDRTYDNPDDGELVADRAPVSERHRRRLARHYFYIGAFILLVVSIAARGDAISGEAARIATDVAQIAVTVLFGSTTAALLSAFVLLGLWIGIKRRSAEALLVGVGIAVLFLLMALQFLVVGWILAGLWFLYYSFMARKAVSFRLVEASSVPEQIRRYVGQGDEVGGRN